jgi:Cu-Zn family superoxide dismutase
MRQKSVVVLAALAIFILFGSGVSGAESSAGTSSARAVIRDASGAVVGTLVLQSTPSGSVLVAAHVNRLPAGFHGFHVHAVGICDPTTTDPATGAPAPFLSAGAHFNPTGATHGHHAGDLPVLLVTAGGAANSAVETDGFTIASLFDADGSAIIVHANPDNLANIPTRYVSPANPAGGPDAATLGTGDSGGRVACGVITRIR